MFLAPLIVYSSVASNFGTRRLLVFTSISGVLVTIIGGFTSVGGWIFVAELPMDFAVSSIVVVNALLVSIAVISLVRISILKEKLFVFLLFFFFLVSALSSWSAV